MKLNKKSKHMIVSINNRDLIISSTKIRINKTIQIDYSTIIIPNKTI